MALIAKRVAPAIGTCVLVLLTAGMTAASAESTTGPPVTVPPPPSPCPVYSPLPSKLTFSPGLPSQELLDTLSVLRRPEPALTRKQVRRLLGRGAPLRGIYASSVRIARAVGGQRFAIIPTASGRTAPVLSEECLQTMPPENAERIRQQQEERLQHPDSVTMLGMVGRHAYGGGGGGANAPMLREQGMGSLTAIHGVCTVSALVPDGVATVTAMIPARRGLPAVERTVPVHDNVIAYRVRRRAAVVLLARTIWRDAAGQVLRDTAAVSP